MHVCCINGAGRGFVMKKIIVVGTFVVLLGAAVPNGSLAEISYPLVSAAESGGSMKKVHLILQKLQDAMASMKDFDELEAVGMPKKSVNRMRRAMQAKINQMMEEVIIDIHRL